jgi:hypothetical protein
MVPALFLAGVYCVDSGIQGGEIVNQKYVLIGGILYLIGLLGQLSHRTTSTSSKD